MKKPVICIFVGILTVISLFCLCACHRHTYEEIQRVDPLCNTDGYITYKCIHCDNTYEESFAALGHAYNETVVRKASCESPGETKYVCTRCGFSYINDKKPEKLGHNYVEQIVKEPTCQAEGVAKYICSRCNDSYQETLPAIAHSYDSNGKCTMCNTLKKGEITLPKGSKTVSFRTAKGVATTFEISEVSLFKKYRNGLEFEFKATKTYDIDGEYATTIGPSPLLVIKDSKGGIAGTTKLYLDSYGSMIVGQTRDYKEACIFDYSPTEDYTVEIRESN